MAAAAAPLPPPGCFRAPRQGESVELTGLHRHAELNGAVGEILAAPQIGEGLATVRLAGGGATKDLKVHLRCLRPSASAPSLPSLSKTPLASEAAGASRVSRPRSSSAALLEASLLPDVDGERSRLARSVAAVSQASGSRTAPSRGRGGSGAASVPPTPGAAAAAAAAAPSAVAARRHRQGGGVEAMRKRFVAKHAKWTRGVADSFKAELGVSGKQARLSTDVTAFEKDFQKSVGMPTYKAFPKDEVKLLDPRTRNVCPPWAPPGNGT